MSVERKYALVRLGPGDYLLPSNDGLVLWRIYSYEENGSAWTVTRDADGREHEHVLRGTFWACARWHGRFDRPGTPALDTIDETFVDWDNWREWSTTLSTRREAIDEALKVGTR